MNFLAHAHLAHITGTSITGNLLGDFVKGRLDNRYSQDWQLGIRLHRKIDIYTDSHTSVHQLKIELGSLRRFAGIILDILFDHVIAKNFSQLSDIELTRFARLVYQEIKAGRSNQPEHFRQVSQRMIETDWLTSYQHLDIIEQVLQRTAQRISIKPDFSPALIWYQQHQQRIDDVALAFYQQLIIHSKEQAIQLAHRDE